MRAMDEKERYIAGFALRSFSFAMNPPVKEVHGRNQKKLSGKPIDVVESGENVPSME